MVVGQRGQRGRRRRKFSIFKVGSYLPLYSTQPCFEGHYSTCVSTNALKICMVLLNTLMEVSPKFQNISSTIPCVIRNVNFVLQYYQKLMNNLFEILRAMSRMRLEVPYKCLAPVLDRYGAGIKPVLGRHYVDCCLQVVPVRARIFHTCVQCRLQICCSNLVLRWLNDIGLVLNVE